jgi:hypothetical protein
MVGAPQRTRSSTGAAALAGTVVGLAAVCLYLGAGLLVGGWNSGEFLAHLSAETVWYFGGTTALVVAFVGLPVAGYLRFDLVAPLAVLVVMLLGWLALGAVQGLLSAQTIFGLALYVVLFSPPALVLYAVLGGGEYLARTGRASP